MGKEVKIGLAVMAALLCIFGGVLVLRLRDKKPVTVARSESAGVKESAKKPGKKKKAAAKISAGKHPPAFGATSRSSTDEADPADDRTIHRNAADDDDSHDVATDDRENAWSNNLDAVSAEAETSADEVPDVADSPYGDRYRQNALVRDDRIWVDDASKDVAAEAVPDETAPDAAYKDRDNVYADRDATENVDDSSGAMTDDVSVPEDRFAGSADQNWADQAEVAADDESPQQSGLSLDRYGEHSDYRLAPLSTADPEVRPAVGRDVDGDFSHRAELSPDTTDDTGDNSAMSSGPPRRLASAADELYVVEANDNFWIISQKVYGTGAYYRALEAHNRPRNGGAVQLTVGEQISTPPAEVLREEYPQLCPAQRRVPASTVRDGSARERSPRLYTVADGDTLFDIARHELGKASRWLEIYELNRDQLGDDFRDLAPGTQLALPGDPPEPIATRPSRDTFQR